MFNSDSPNNASNRSQPEECDVELAYRIELFGRMLVLNEIIDQATLDQAKRQWNVDKTKSLGEKLVECGAVENEDRRVVEMLVDRHIAKHGFVAAKCPPSIGDEPTADATHGSPYSTVTYVPKRPGALVDGTTFGDYELISPIAKGGMGIVYKARQVRLNRFVALKRILAGEFPDEEQIKRFYAEAEAAGKLDHPGIVPVHEVGFANGQHFYSMAFIDGRSLNDLVKTDGPLQPRLASQLIKATAEAIQYAHEKGIVHRDIKPANILLDAEQQPRVTDFGLAKRIHVASDLTATGQVVGTPTYMSPEQARGKSEQVGCESDVYSLGATLYYLLIGRPPFQSTSQAETLRQVVETEPTPPRRLDPSIPRDLETICLKCLRKEPEKRYTAAAALAQDLENWLNNKPIAARRVSRIERAWLWCKRRPVIAFLIAVLTVISVSAFAVVWEIRERTYAAGLIEAIGQADVDQLPDLLMKLDIYRRRVEPSLIAIRESEPKSADDRRMQLHARLATVSYDKSQVPILFDELLSNHISYVGIIRDQLESHRDMIVELLRELFRDETEPVDHRFRAGIVLVKYVAISDSELWTTDAFAFLAQQLVLANSEHQPRLRQYLRTIQDSMQMDLSRIFADPKATDSQRLSAANAFADYSASDVARLARLLADATPEQFAVLYPLVAASPSPSIMNDLGEITATPSPEELGLADGITFGQRRANAAATLLRLGERERAFPVFDWTVDPEALTQFIFRCRPRGIGVDAVLDCLQLARNSRSDGLPRDARYALVLALGEFTLSEIPAAQREPLLTLLTDWYAQDPSSGVHAASGWLLRHWGLTELAVQIDQKPVPYSLDREWFTMEVEVQLASERKSFYYTFIVFPAGDYIIGSDTDDPVREKDEARHLVRLTRPFAMLDREIAFEELIAFSPQYERFMAAQSDASSAVAGFGTDWYDSVRFCRWLGKQFGLAEADQPYASPESLDKNLYPREPNPLANWAPRNWPVDLNRPGFRLPTEAEWEIAARGGALGLYSYGSDEKLMRHFGWYIENCGKRVHPPRELRPSIRGLFDVHGNLHEWTYDWHNDFGIDAVTDPVGPQEASFRTFRSAGWAYDAAYCRTAYRGAVIPTSRNLATGFRLAMSPSGLSSPADNNEAPPCVGTEERSGVPYAVGEASNCANGPKCE